MRCRYLPGIRAASRMIAKAVREIAAHQGSDVPSDSIAHSSGEALEAAEQESVDGVLLIEGGEIVGGQAAHRVLRKERLIGFGQRTVGLIEHLQSALNTSVPDSQMS